MPIGRANSVDTGLRWSNLRRSGKAQPYLFRSVWIVAISTGRVAVVIQQFALAG
ncbi:MAG: hypothetical protein ABSF59_14735 [Candidatus Sulfotelmatobacter sp.]